MVALFLVCVFFSPDKEKALWLGDLPRVTQQWQSWNRAPDLADIHLKVSSQEAFTDLPEYKDQPPEVHAKNVASGGSLQAFRLKSGNDLPQGGGPKVQVPSSRLRDRNKVQDTHQAFLMERIQVRL